MSAAACLLCLPVHCCLYIELPPLSRCIQRGAGHFLDPATTPLSSNAAQKTNINHQD
eukprot:NODE_28512_length_475_cov_1.991379.p2 GENE.NODE_28512_length_475_cov_1.991379~~NODE_28512_length_475_cov_1.991379.p2  ORF type:complete len:57 (+),score=1.38 NODE_28512_length_475_cov_1.991379:206-376(+)